MEIFRQETAEERKDFKPLRPSNEQDIFEKFRKQSEKIEADHFNLFKPFCLRCARIDFKEQVEKKIKDREQVVGYETDTEKFNIKIPDLKEYGNPDRFILNKESKAMEPVKSSDALTRQVQIGIHRDFKCKERGCGVSIFIPNENLEKEKVSGVSKPKDSTK